MYCTYSSTSFIRQNRGNYYVVSSVPRNRITQSYIFGLAPIMSITAQRFIWHCASKWESRKAARRVWLGVLGLTVQSVWDVGGAWAAAAAAARALCLHYQHRDDNYNRYEAWLGLCGQLKDIFG